MQTPCLEDSQVLRFLYISQILSFRTVSSQLTHCVLVTLPFIYSSSNILNLFPIQSPHLLFLLPAVLLFEVFCLPFISQLIYHLGNTQLGHLSSYASSLKFPSTTFPSVMSFVLLIIISNYLNYAFMFLLYIFPHLNITYLRAVHFMFCSLSYHPL